MSAAKSKSDVKVLKGQEAEDKVLEYLRMMNRPYGAVDVSSNLKGAVPKTATQKILTALAEKGELTQKVYGKTTFFVVNQSKLQAMSAEECAKIEDQLKAIEEENKALNVEAKSLTNELAKLKSTLTDEEVEAQITEVSQQIQQITSHLVPLRAGTSLISAEELAQLDQDWLKWRSEWVRRRKIFNEFWGHMTDSKTPNEADEYREELGIEVDTQEHLRLESSVLCQPRPSNALKRKR